MNKILALMEAFSLNRGQACYRLGVNKSYLSMMINNKKPVSKNVRERIEKIAQFEALIAGDPVDAPLLKKEMIEYINSY